MSQNLFMPPRGLLLDLDGTLAHSLPVLQQVYHAFLARRSIKGSEAEFQKLNGPPLRTVVEMLRQNHGLDGGPDELFAEYWALVQEMYPVHAEPNPGARGLLQAAAGWGMNVGLVTSAPRALAEGFLEANQLDGFIAPTVSAEDVTSGKPEPEPYLLALERLGLAAGETVAVEDSADGVRSAASAGLYTLGLALPAKARELIKAGAALTVCDLMAARDILALFLDRA